MMKRTGCVAPSARRAARILSASAPNSSSTSSTPSAPVRAAMLPPEPSSTKRLGASCELLISTLLKSWGSSAAAASEVSVAASRAGRRWRSSMGALFRRLPAATGRRPMLARRPGTQASRGSSQARAATVYTHSPAARAGAKTEGEGRRDSEGQDTVHHRGEPRPKLPGTIYSAAEEVERAGGRALPLIVDVRDEATVVAAAQRCAETFGGIDICINNASAINLAPTAEIDMR